jgi:short-subunit dehydrogenase
MSFLKDRNILITGATGGLGKEMVKQFLFEGSNLILTDLDDKILSGFISTLNESQKSKIIFSFTSDLSNKEGCEKVYQTIKDKNIKIDVLVNNAGVATIGNFVSTPENLWELQYAVNLLAPVRLTKLFLQDMLKNDSGHLVNIASVASFVPAVGLSTYASTKHGLRAFGEALHEELKDSKIKVTNLYPFFTKTPMMDSPQFGFKDKKSIPDFLMSTPEDVIRDLISGIKSDSLHVFPGLISRTTEFVNRFIPDGIKFFMQYLK